MKNTQDSKALNESPISLLEEKIDWNLFAITSIWIYLVLTFFCIFA